MRDIDGGARVDLYEAVPGLRGNPHSHFFNSPRRFSARREVFAPKTRESICEFFGKNREFKNPKSTCGNARN